MKELADRTALEEAFDAPRALVFKYSTQCGLSKVAMKQVLQFAEIFPAAPIYRLKVIENRLLSDEVEDRTRVRHETPQVILLQAGNPLFHASHRRVRMDVVTGWWQESSPR
jgi:bacillithiol system protein YtxJ